MNDTYLIHMDNARTYGEWIGKRFKDSPNIIWSVGGDRDPRGYEDIYRAVAYGLREGSCGAHLMAYHTFGAARHRDFFHHEDWLDFNIIQTWDAWHRIYPS